jgi:hypothetical protein
MIPAAPERRRAQRVTVRNPSWLSVPASWPVQLIDVAMGGLSFFSPHRVDVGRVVSLRATLSGLPFNAQVRICWSKPRQAANAIRPRYEVGATFLQMDDSSRRSLERFLGLSTTD